MNAVNKDTAIFLFNIINILHAQNTDLNTTHFTHLIQIHIEQQCNLALSLWLL